MNNKLPLSALAALVLAAPAAAHAPIAHMDITRKAYELYASRYEGGELEKYIGDAKDGEPVPDDQGTVVGGSHDEDMSLKNPWSDLFPMANHFWDCRQGLYKGLMNNDSGVDRAYKYWSGGYGIENKFDRGWRSTGVKGEGVIALYHKGDKAKAYWYLGHVAHLLEDLTVPAHVLLYPHINDGDDAYETYMKHHFADWAPDEDLPIRSFATLYDLFYQTANVTNDFDAGSGPGRKGADGKVDQGRRRAAGFTEEQLKEEGNALMPLAYKRVASLFVFFFREVDKTPPTVTLRDPQSDSAVVALRADAKDELSGVDRRGYRFESRDLEEDLGWKSVTEAPSGSSVRFAGKPGHLYSFRVSAADAAGNRATSAPKAWRAGSPSVARR